MRAARELMRDLEQPRNGPTPFLAPGHEARTLHAVVIVAFESDRDDPSGSFGSPQRSRTSSVRGRRAVPGAERGWRARSDGWPSEMIVRTNWGAVRPR
jgi:hypothetical protein